MGGLCMHGMRLGSAVVVQSKLMHYGTQWTHGIVNPSICGLASYVSALIQVQLRYPQAWFLGSDLIELKKSFALQLPHTIATAVRRPREKTHGLM